MKQTAVEWLIDQMLKQGYFDVNKPKSITNLDHLQHQAIEMEIQQIQNACSKVYDDVKSIEISDEDIERIANEYLYNDMLISKQCFTTGAKWYRQKIKSRQ